jgi:hypothetical protein
MEIVDCIVNIIAALMFAAHRQKIALLASGKICLQAVDRQMDQAPL